MAMIASSKRPISPRHKQAITYAVNQIMESNLCPYVDDVILYGSCSRESARWDSDVDICLVLNPDVRKQEDYRRSIHWLKGGISEPNADSAEVDLKILIGDEWEKNQTLFYRNLRRDGISLWR